MWPGDPWPDSRAGTQLGLAEAQRLGRNPVRVKIDLLHDHHLVVRPDKSAKGFAGGVGSKDLDLGSLGIEHGAGIPNRYQHGGLDFGGPEQRLGRLVQGLDPLALFPLGDICPVGQIQSDRGDSRSPESSRLRPHHRHRHQSEAGIHSGRGRSKQERIELLLAVEAAAGDEDGAVDENIGRDDSDADREQCSKRASGAKRVDVGDDGTEDDHCQGCLQREKAQIEGKLLWRLATNQAECKGVANQLGRDQTDRIDEEEPGHEGNSLIEKT